MFLTTDKPVTAFDYTRDHGISCSQSAIEAELHYLLSDPENAITVDMVGDIAILGGVCGTPEDAQKALDVASDIAGRGNVISQIVIVTAASRRGNRLF